MRPEELRDFELTESQKMIRVMARDFAQKEIAPNVQQWEKDGHYPKDIVRKMGELGMLGAFIPEEYGGAGLDHLSLDRWYIVDGTSDVLQDALPVFPFCLVVPASDPGLHRGQ